MVGPFLHNRPTESFEACSPSIASGQVHLTKGVLQVKNLKGDPGEGASFQTLCITINDRVFSPGVFSNLITLEILVFVALLPWILMATLHRIADGLIALNAFFVHPH